MREVAGTVRREAASCRGGDARIPADRAGIVAETVSSPFRATRWRTSSISTSSREEPVTSHGGRVGGRREKEFRLRGRRRDLPEPIRVRRCRNRCIFCFVYQLRRGFAALVREGRGRPPFLPSRPIRHLFGSFRRGAAKIVRYRSRRCTCRSTRPTRSCDGVCWEPRRRRDARDAAADPPGSSFTDRSSSAPASTTARSSPEPSGSSPAFARLRTVAVVPVGLTSHRAGLPRYARHARPGAGDARPAQRVGKEIGKGRTASRLRSPPTIFPAADGTFPAAVVRIVRADRKRRGVSGGSGTKRLLFRRKRWPGRRRRNRGDGSVRGAPCRRIP